MISPQRRREVIDALRRGTVPQQCLDALAVGLDRIAPAIDEELRFVASGSAGFKAIRGEYGSGKTFAVRWLAERARRAGFRKAMPGGIGAGGSFSALGATRGMTGPQDCPPYLSGARGSPHNRHPAGDRGRLAEIPFRNPSTSGVRQIPAGPWVQSPLGSGGIYPTAAQ